MSLHEEGVFFEAIDSADEGYWSAHELVDLLDTDEGMGFSVHCLDFL